MLVYSRYSNPTRRRRRIRFTASKRTGLTCLYVTTTIVILLQIATWLNAEEIFALNEIIVQGNKLLSDKQVLSLVETETSANLFNFDLRAMAAKITAHPYVKQASVSRRLPDDLVIQVVEETPLALMNNGQMQLIGEAGQSLPYASKFQYTDYPVVNYKADENKGLTAILSYLRDCKQHQFLLYSQISEISYSDEIGVYFYLTKTGIPVIVGHAQDRNQGKHLLQVLTILKNNKMLAEVKALDLRYRNQVVIKSKLS